MESVLLDYFVEQQKKSLGENDHLVRKVPF
jgi:hypothetical protein